MKIFYLFTCFVLTIFVNACTTTKFVPVETVRVDSIIVARVASDSIYKRDSIFVAVKADTVFKTVSKYVYRDRLIHDTVRIVSCDTIARIVEVEKELSFWERQKLELGGVAFWLIPLLLGVVLFIKRK